MRFARLSTTALLIATATAVAGPTEPASAATPTDLLISEYVEGTSFNKAIEIFNGTGAAVELDPYTLELYSNGSATASQTVALSGTVAAGDVVVVSRSDADPAIVAVTDVVAPAVANFNGDDAVVLRKAGSVVDAFGQVGVDPGSEWPGGGVDDTLRRSPSVCAGDADAADPFDAAIEWVAFGVNTFDGLGAHAADCGDGDGELAPLRFSEIHYDNAMTDTDEAIEVFGPAGTDLTGWRVVLYNGNDGTEYDTAGLSGSIPDLDGTGSGVVTVTYPSNGIQNGSPDGMALVAPDDTTVELLSYEGAFTAADGPAAGLTSTDIGVAESGTGAADQSLQRDADGAWSGPRCASFGQLNDPAAPATCAAPSSVVLNEVLVSTAGTDSEYVELFGAPATSLAGLSIIGVEGDAGSQGSIDFRVDLAADAAVGDNGFFLLANPTAASTYGITADVVIGENALENGSTTYALVETASIPATGLEGIVVLDGLASSDGGAGDVFYFDQPVLGPDGTFLPAGWGRATDGIDTDAAADWVLLSFDNASPPNSPTAGAGDAPTEYTPTAIPAIQGSGMQSTLVGAAVEIDGTVVGDFQGSAGLGGFYVQELLGDGDPTTSDGIFVHQGPSGPDVLVGDVVVVRGRVAEFNGALTQIDNVAALDVVSSGNPLPDPTDLVLPADDAARERVEGMLVTIPHAVVISEYFNYDRFGEIVLTTARQVTPTAIVEPGAPATALAAQYATERITLDDGLSVQNPGQVRHPDGEPFSLDNRFRGGDALTGVTGVMDFAFGLYRIQPTQGAEHAPTNQRPDPPDVGGTLRVASFNVLNYFTSIDTGAPVCGPANDQECRGADTEAERVRQLDKIVAAMTAMDADVIGIIEVENTTGVEAMADIVEGLNAIEGAGTYAYLDTGTIGTDAIKVGFIHRVAAAVPVGAYAILDSTVDARFLDSHNRPTLAQTFSDSSTGGKVTVAVNHLKSKGSDCNDVGDPDIGDGQGNCNGTRTEAAAALADWMDGDPTATGVERSLVIGDLNSYDKEDPVDVLTGAGYTDLIAAHGGEGAYSYVFDGQVGYLDHALADADLAPLVAGAAAWHINADEPDLIDYDMTFKPTAPYAPDQFRSSDHDPIVIGLALAPPPPACAERPATIVGTEGPDLLVGTNGPDVIVALGGNDLVLAGGGNDVVCAGAGVDVVEAGSGIDQVFGEAGIDTVLGGNGDDLIDGGEGIDIAVGGSGTDTCIAELALTCEPRRWLWF